MKTLFRGCLTLIAFAFGVAVLGVALSNLKLVSQDQPQDNIQPVSMTPEQRRRQREVSAELLRQAEASDAAKAKAEAEATAKREAANRVRDAFYMAQEFVKDSLKAPSTASFESWHSDECGGAEVIPGKFCVWGVVEAKNPFGVPLKEKWRVALYLRPDKQYVRLFQRIGDQDLGDPGVFVADGGGPIISVAK